MSAARVVRSSLLALAFGSFIVLGLPDGMLGVAWPSMSTTFDVPLGALGILLTAFTVGYVTTSLLLGTLIARFGYARVLITSLAALGTSGVLFVLSPLWILVVVAATVMGTGAGLLDGGLNAFGAHRFRPRDLNWLHAAYGIGATIGPFVMTPLVVTGRSWRIGYLLVAALSAVGTVLFLRRRSAWTIAENEDKTETDGVETTPAAGATGGRRAIVLVSVALFFLYTGIEVVAGQWAFSLLSISRRMPAAGAGAAVAVYYGALTVGRIVFGFISERIQPTRLLRIVLSGALLGTALIWIPAPTALAPVGLALLGFSLAPVFPMLVGQTPDRVGPRLASHMIGIQIAAANLGAVTFVGLTGIGVEVWSLEIVGPSLVGAALAFVLLHELLLALSPATPAR